MGRNPGVGDALMHLGALVQHQHWRLRTEKMLSLEERRGTGEKPLCPTDGAAEDMRPSLCQLPLTHPLAALRHWVKVPAPQCAHMK